MAKNNKKSKLNRQVSIIFKISTFSHSSHLKFLKVAKRLSHRYPYISHDSQRGPICPSIQ